MYCSRIAHEGSLRSHVDRTPPAMRSASEAPAGRRRASRAFARQQRSGRSAAAIGVCSRSGRDVDRTEYRSIGRLKASPTNGIRFLELTVKDARPWSSAAIATNGTISFCRLDLGSRIFAGIGATRFVEVEETQEAITDDPRTKRVATRIASVSRIRDLGTREPGVRGSHQRVLDWMSLDSLRAAGPCQLGKARSPILTHASRGR